jgi:hypothetical protein
MTLGVYIIDESESITDDPRVIFQLGESFMIAIYDDYNFIVQAPDLEVDDLYQGNLQ